MCIHKEAMIWKLLAVAGWNGRRTVQHVFDVLPQAALPYLRKGARVINTTSVTAYRGSSHLLDYSATKGAIVAFMVAPRHS